MMNSLQLNIIMRSSHEYVEVDLNAKSIRILDSVLLGVLITNHYLLYCMSKEQND